MAQKIQPETAAKHIEENQALLVCAYDSEEKFADARLDGAISLAQLRSRESELPKEQELIFY